ncbi:PPE family protein [Mycobacterium sp. 663a-19]|nr:PPE family protein [Mycobacterium sp. 663a-19]
MDFAALPPEINSGLMYAGPGSGPMMAAAAAWDGLAAELAAAAAGYGSVVSELTGAPWVGPASASMLSAVTPYVSWLDTMAGQAEETANQARAAAAAYETAFMMTVPPPVIAANRVLLATLIATNFFGQNTPAIAATEAQYLEMWAQDATTMYGYLASSAAASRLAPFRSPPNTTTPQAPADQAVAVAQAQATPAGNSGQTVASITPQLASTTAAPATQAPATTTTGSLTTATGALGVPNPQTPWWQLSPANYDTVLKRMTGLPYFSEGLGTFGVAIGQQLFNGPVGTTAGAQGAFFVTPQFAALGAGGWTWHPAALPAATASLSSATKIGGLSVPQSWAAATGVEEPAATKLVSTTLLSNPEAANGGGVNAAMRGVPLVGGRGAQRAGALGVRYGFRYNVLTRPPSAG